MQCSLCKKDAHRIVNGKGFCGEHKKEAFEAQQQYAKTERSKAAVKAYEAEKAASDVRLNGPRGLKGSGDHRW